MDEGVRTVAELLASGGNAALLFLVYVIWRATSGARDFAQGMRAELREIKDALKAQADMTRETGRRVEAIDQRMIRQEELRAMLRGGAGG